MSTAAVIRGDFNAPAGLLRIGLLKRLFSFSARGAAHGPFVVSLFERALSRAFNLLLLPLCEPDADPISKTGPFKLRSFVTLTRLGEMGRLLRDVVGITRPATVLPAARRAPRLAVRCYSD